MTELGRSHVFFSYNSATEAFVEALARRLHSDARLAFWFAPWHAIPGAPLQEQMEDALGQAQACAVFIGGGERIEGWQNEQMRTAIQARVEDEPGYRVIPVLLPGVTPPNPRALPRFLRCYEPVEFTRPDDEQAFQRLLAGILGIPPIQVAGFIAAERSKALRLAPTGHFAHGHALLIGVAHYPKVRPLPATVLNDARDLHALLTDPARCGYPPAQVIQLLDGQATGAAIRAALTALAADTGPDDTVVVFFSGHGTHDPAGGDHGQYLLPYDCDLSDLRSTAIAGDEMTTLLRPIKAGRLLVLFDACHSGGAGDPKGLLPQFKGGLDERYYAALAQGKGRVVMASSRPEEVSWALAGMRNSLFTHFVLAALRGEAKTLGDGYVRVFDLFRHVADQVPARAAQVNATQHPIFKATAMEEDFPVALCRSNAQFHAHPEGSQEIIARYNADQAALFNHRHLIHIFGHHAIERRGQIMRRRDAVELFDRRHGLAHGRSRPRGLRQGANIVQRDHAGQLAIFGNKEAALTTLQDIVVDQRRY